MGLVWTHLDGMSFADSGAAVVCGAEGWEAFPFGVGAGGGGVHPSRAEAIAVAEHMAAGVYCCSGEGPGHCD